MDTSKIKRFVFTAIAVILITAFGIALLYYDNGRYAEVEEPTAVEPASVTEEPTSTVTVILNEDMYIDGKLDINKASVQALDSLPEIGPTLAARIVSYRAEHPFKVIRDLKKVSGIGDKIYAAIEDYVCVGSAE